MVAHLVQLPNAIRLTGLNAGSADDEDGWRLPLQKACEIVSARADMTSDRTARTPREVRVQH